MCDSWTASKYLRFFQKFMIPQKTADDPRRTLDRSQPRFVQAECLFHPFYQLEIYCRLNVCSLTNNLICCMLYCKFYSNDGLFCVLLQVDCLESLPVSGATGVLLQVEQGLPRCSGVPVPILLQLDCHVLLPLTSPLALRTVVQVLRLDCFGTIGHAFEGLSVSAILQYSIKRPF